MCFALFGCCGPPPYATIKAYFDDTHPTTPGDLDWYDDRDSGSPERETAIIDWNDEAGYSIGVLSAGHGAQVTGSTNEGVLLEHDADDGDRQSESTSSPKTGELSIGGWTSLLKMTAVSGPSGGSWMWSPTGGFGFLVKDIFQFFDLSLAQQCDIELSNTAQSGVNSMGIKENGPAIIGYYASGIASNGFPDSQLSSPVAREYSTSGSLTTSLLRSGLTITGGRSPRQTGCIVPRADSVDGFLAFGDEVPVFTNTYYRRLWVCSKSSMSETVAGTPVLCSSASQRYASIPRDGGKASQISSTHAILHLMDGTLVCVDLSTPAEAWTKSDKTRRFVALDSTQVYTLDPTAGELSAVTLSGGSEAWTLDLSDEEKLDTHSGQVYGSILASGNIAVWRNAGVTIVSPSGTEIATVDVGPCYGIVEKSSRWIIVGAKRTTES